MATPTHEVIRNSIPEHSPWEDDHDPAFSQLKLTLQQTPALGLPNYTKPFTLIVPEHDNQALGLLTRARGGKRRPVATAHTQKREPEHAQTLRGVAAAARLAEASAELLLGYDVCLPARHVAESL